MNDCTDDGIEVLSEHVCYGGVQGFYRHDSSSIGLPMRFAVFKPAQASTGPVPTLFYLAGLTCTRPLSKLLQIEIMNSANQVKAQSKAAPAVSILATDDLKAFDPTDHMLIEHTQAG
jgi:S-formylglutathione hydrolase FrmB